MPDRYVGNKSTARGYGGAEAGIAKLHIPRLFGKGGKPRGDTVITKVPKKNRRQQEEQTDCHRFRKLFFGGSGILFFIGRVKFVSFRNQFRLVDSQAKNEDGNEHNTCHDGEKHKVIHVFQATDAVARIQDGGDDEVEQKTGSSHQINDSVSFAS